MLVSSFQPNSGAITLDFAKEIIDEGFHPMTMYFPLVVHGAMLMEPTETESKETLDLFIETVKGLKARAAYDSLQLSDLAINNAIELVGTIVGKMLAACRKNSRIGQIIAECLEVQSCSIIPFDFPGKLDFRMLCPRL